MMKNLRNGALLFLILGPTFAACTSAAAADDSPAELMEKARAAGDARRHEDAARLTTEVIEIAPDYAIAYYLRGRHRFCLGRIHESLADFDKYLELLPDRESRLWERGIALYYAGKYEEGAKQFALYQTYFQNDVENATWRYLCMARSVGVDKARAELLPVAGDRRVPMMEIYALYRGDAKPEDVLAAATAGNPLEERLNEQLFYAHLYLGLYWEAQGNRQRAKEHLVTASERHKIGHYMWDVAKLHAGLLSEKKK